MREFPLRSPSATVGGIVYFGRMLDKIRLQAQGNLPADYQANLGKGFDQSCVTFLEIDYQELKARVLRGGSDAEILQWCFEKSQNRSIDEIFVWNEFMRKRGWNDDVTPMLSRRKRQAGWEKRSDIQTMFEFIDLDEGRIPARNEGEPTGEGSVTAER